MKKILAVALLAVPLTFAQTPANNTDTTPAKTAKGKKHKKHGKTATTDAAPAPSTTK